LLVDLNPTHGSESWGRTGVDDSVNMVTDDNEDVYRVLMLGGPDVGKTAITQQFLTSEYMAAQNTSFG